MSGTNYSKVRELPLKQLCNVNVRSATGSDLKPLGIVDYTFSIGNTQYTHPFIVCQNLGRSTILGRDFLRQNRLHVGWSREGTFQIQSGKNILIESIHAETKPIVKVKKTMIIPTGNLAVVELQTTIPNMEVGTYYDFKPSEKYLKQGINLIMVPIIYHTATPGIQTILQVFINFELGDITLREGTTVGYLENVRDNAGRIETPTVNESVCSTGI